MKPCWFCYKLTFLRCQLPVGSNVALRWCILRKSCTGRKEKNWIWKRKARICPLVDHAGRLSRFSTEERARFQFLIANLLLQWTTLSNPWWTQPLEMINFFSWWTHFGLFKVHLQIALKALQSFFIKELGSFCQFCKLPNSLSAYQYQYMLHLFTLPTTLTTGLIPQTRKTKSVSGLPDKSVHLRPSVPKHHVRASTNSILVKKTNTKHLGHRTNFYTSIQIVCIGSGIQRICCVPNSIYINVQTEVFLQWKWTNVIQVISSPAQHTNTVEIHSLTKTVGI